MQCFKRTLPFIMFLPFYDESRTFAQIKTNGLYVSILFYVIYLEQHSCIMKDVHMNGTDEHHKI